MSAHAGECCNLALFLLPFVKSHAASSFAPTEALTVTEVGAEESTMNKCPLLMVLEGYFLHRSFWVDSMSRKKVESTSIIVTLSLLDSLVRACSLVHMLSLW